MNACFSKKTSINQNEDLEQVLKRFLKTQNNTLESGFR